MQRQISLDHFTRLVPRDPLPRSLTFDQPYILGPVEGLLVPVQLFLALIIVEVRKVGVGCITRQRVELQ